MLTHKLKTQIKMLLLMLSLGIAGIANATTYYFSSSTGDDSRTAAQAQNAATPWKTLSKLNSFFSSLNAGDNVLFLRGDIFPGTITPTKNGASGNPITFSAYGTGAKPIISGFTTVPSWTNLGSNIWESTSTVSGLSSLNMVVINGTNTPMGRYPNTGYMAYQSSTASSITSSSLTGSPNWTGAEAVMRMYRWVIDRNPINSQSGGTLNFTDNDPDYDPTNGFGFFIQNDVRTLDTQNEWYYNPSTKKLRIYSISTPANVQVATVTNLVSISTKDYLTFDNLSLQGANERAVYCNGGNKVTIQYCDILYSGTDAVYSYPNAPNIKVQYCNINNSNNSAIDLGNSDAGIIQHNTINNTGVFPGMGNYTNSTFTAVVAKGDFSDISYNHIDTAGYNGIYFAGSGTNVRYNYINYVCFNKDDGGGIYCYPLQGVGQTYASKRTVQGNTVLNSIGALESATGSQSNGHLIYNDGADDNTDYLDNTMAHTAYGGFGIFFNNARNSTVRNNTIYDCWKGFYYIKYTGLNMDNNKIVNNIFVAKTAGYYPAYYEPDETNMTSTTILDSNVYARPIDDNKTVWYGVNATNVYYTLAEWKSFTGREPHSTKSPVSISTLNDLRFEYNETSVSKTISLGTNYINMKGISYPGSITLQPYTSAVLIKSGAGNASPTASAGSDQTITLPTITSSLAGSGTDPDGTIASYLWTKVSGPTSGTITSTTSANTTVTALTAGVYKFELKVTDNGGAVARDTMQITENATTNQAPTANAGSDQTIVLPTSTVSFTGSGTDPDGTVASYLWTKVSGPTTGTITSATSASTTITALVQGVYKFELKVTDNSAATGRDTIQVTVNAAGNQVPVANAGVDKTLTLPTNTATLTGSGTDADGTIASYLWTKVSGPTTGTITSTTSASTTITALVQGVYKFELKVTDNSAATGRDTIQVTVNAAGNQAPTANAGSDQSITLPIAAVTLTGSGTDPDGTISSYVWAKLSGPATGTITNVTAAATATTGLSAGTYVFELTVTDNAGATAKDNIQVIVNPVVSAGLKIIHVNVYGGTNPYNDVRWNNWQSVANVTSSNFKYEDGSQSTVNAIVSKQTKIQDNGAGYVSTATICPPAVLRYASAEKTSRTLTIKGLDPAKMYSFDLFASSTVTGNKTEFVIAGSNYIISTDNNKNGYAEYFNVHPNSSGTVAVTLNSIGTWNYISGFNITEQTGTVAGVTPIQAKGEIPQISEVAPEVKVVPEVETVINIFPNPFTTSVQVQLNGKISGVYQLSIFDISGKIIWRKAINKSGGSVTETINTANIPGGAYLLQVLSPDQKKTVQKLIKAN